MLSRTEECYLLPAPPLWIQVPNKKNLLKQKLSWATLTNTCRTGRGIGQRPRPWWWGRRACGVGGGRGLGGTTDVRLGLRKGGLGCARRRRSSISTDRFSSTHHEGVAAAAPLLTKKWKKMHYCVVDMWGLLTLGFSEAKTIQPNGFQFFHSLRSTTVFPQPTAHNSFSSFF
jgi:hypothetical protein